MTSFFRTHAPLIPILIAVIVLAFLPSVTATLMFGEGAWERVPQSYTDEILYYAHIDAIADQYPGHGNPYFIEHKDDAPLVLFGGTWLAAIPMMLGLSLSEALIVNLMLWGALFVILFYTLFRTFLLPRTIASLGAFAAYLGSYDQIFRLANRQEVFPFFLLFYIALARFLAKRTRVSIALLGITAGIPFYLDAYLWQTVVATLGLVFLYALSQKDWRFVKETLTASAIGGAIGMGGPLYMLWLSHKEGTLFWDSIARFGLVHTHIPMAELITSGGFVLLLLAGLGLIYWRVPSLRTDPYFRSVAFFLAVTGIALWVMQGSNAITGKLLETGEHIRRYIVLYLVFGTTALGYLLYRFRTQLPRTTALASIGIVVVLIGTNITFGYQYLSPFILVNQNRAIWEEQQTYTAPLAWLDANVDEPSVIWTDPHSYLTIHVPVLTKHYVLYAEPAILTLVSDQELQERYLVSQYFENPDVTYVRDDLRMYTGRQTKYHIPGTKAREVKICRIVRFYDSASCGTPPSAADLLGDTFFEDLAKKSATDVQPNITTYLEKYHVAYMLLEKDRNASWKPGDLGGELIYEDELYEIYALRRER